MNDAEKKLQRDTAAIAKALEDGANNHREKHYAEKAAVLKADELYAAELKAASARDSRNPEREAHDNTLAAIEGRDAVWPEEKSKPAPASATPSAAKKTTTSKKKASK